MNDSVKEQVETLNRELQKLTETETETDTQFLFNQDPVRWTPVELILTADRSQKSSQQFSPSQNLSLQTNNTETKTHPFFPSHLYYSPSNHSQYSHSELNHYQLAHLKAQKLLDASNRPLFSQHTVSRIC